ncbi:MAG: sugar transferase [Bacteroidota bacterium]
MKRALDLLLVSAALLVLWPLLLIIALAIVLDSRGGVIYEQERIGKGEQPFRLYKFRTMRPASDREGLLSLGSTDQRITPIGHFLRRYRLDELPQLWNILIGDMSIVGPRPEVPHYVQHFTEEEKQTLRVRPGLTDYATLEYLQEGELLAQSSNPEQTYIQDILPQKLALSRRYIQERSLGTDVKIIWKTLAKLWTS